MPLIEDAVKMSFLIVHISSSFSVLNGSLFPQCPGVRGHSSPMSVRVNGAVTRQCWMGALQIQSQVESLAPLLVQGMR